MPLLRVHRGDVPVAEIDLPATGLEVGTRPGDALRLDELGLRAGPDDGGRLEPRNGAWAWVPRGVESVVVPFRPGERLPVVDGWLEVLAPVAGPLLDVAALPHEGPPPNPAPPVRPSSEPSSRRLRALGDVLASLEKGDDVAGVFGRALDAAVGELRAIHGFAGLLEADGKTLRVLASRGMDPRDPRGQVSRGIVDAVLKQGREVCTGDAPSVISTASVQMSGIRSVGAVPLRLGGVVAGILYVDAGSTLVPYGPDDLALLRLLAALCTRRIAEDERARDAEEVGRAAAGAKDREVVEDEVLGWESPPMRRVRDEAERLVRAFRGRSLPILVSGETGAGKEVIARWIHARAEGGRGRFVAVNCAAIPHDLAESELFGIEQGVATGVLRRLGKFQQADGGTLFLDEVGEMPMALQGKLLRAIETRRIQRVGGREEVAVDVRLVSATNRSLEESIRAKTFREDLYWRLCGLELRVPPLRERKEDVPALARAFLQRFAKEYHADVRDFTPKAMEALVAYAWPGNVRELKQRIGAMVILARGRSIDVGDLPPTVRSQGAPPGKSHGLQTLAALESEHIRSVVDAVGGDLHQAAAALGIHKKTLARKLRGEA
jgi:DNA-binding NtrC family response regulator